MNGGRTAMSTEDEVGATDNSLHLNPNDPMWKDSVGDWEDGKTYVFTNVRVEQVSPGEYKVLSAEAGEAEQPPKDGEAEQGASGAEEKGRGGYPNKAVQSMMES